MVGYLVDRKSEGKMIRTEDGVGTETFTNHFTLALLVYRITNHNNTVICSCFDEKMSSCMCGLV